MAAILLASPAAALAQVPGPVAVGAQVGTPGLGANIQFALNDVIVLRGGYDVLQWDRDDSYQDVDYNAEIDFKSPGAFVDLHPFRNSFFVSGGAYFGERGVDLDATPTRDVRIGGVTFTPAQVGRLDGRMRDLYRRSSVVAIALHPTVTGSGLTVVLEAMASGRPVIAYGRGGALDTVVDGETGLVVDGWDVGAIAAAGALLAVATRPRVATPVPTVPV